MTPAERDLYVRTLIGEAGGEDPDGQAAVAHVIRNRLLSGRFGGDLSSVIKAPKQFSTWDAGNPAGIMAQRVPTNSPQYQRMGQLVDDVNSGRVPDPTGGAMSFYNPSQANPDWSKSLQHSKAIGSHVFGVTPDMANVKIAAPQAPAQPQTMQQAVAARLAGSAPGVDPRLAKILQQASSSLPDGYTAKIVSGLREGDPRFHGRGMATDLQIIDPQGNPLANYQDAKTFRTYEQLAQAARRTQMQVAPELSDQFRWGGYFSGGKGKYGALDLMHFDLGGGNGLGMAGGSWEKGLTDQQRALFPGVQSAGMADSQPPVQMASAQTGTFAAPGSQTAAPADAAMPPIAPGDTGSDSGLGGIFASLMSGMSPQTQQPQQPKTYSQQLPPELFQIPEGEGGRPASGGAYEQAPDLSVNPQRAPLAPPQMKPPAFGMTAMLGGMNQLPGRPAGRLA